jgi:hypothetical protein
MYTTSSDSNPHPLEVCNQALTRRAKTRLLSAISHNARHFLRRNCSFMDRQPTYPLPAGDRHQRYPVSITNTLLHSTSSALVLARATPLTVYVLCIASAIGLTSGTLLSIMVLVGSPQRAIFVDIQYPTWPPESKGRH